MGLLLQGHHLLFSKFHSLIKRQDAERELMYCIFLASPNTSLGQHHAPYPLIKQTPKTCGKGVQLLIKKVLWLALFLTVLFQTDHRVHVDSGQVSDPVGAHCSRFSRGVCQDHDLTPCYCSQEPNPGRGVSIAFTIGVLWPFMNQKPSFSAAVCF